jgi:hypothetical protein
LKISKSTRLILAHLISNIPFWLYITSLKRAILTVIYFFGRFCDVAKSGDDQQEDLARIGYKKNMKAKFSKTLFYISGYLLEPRIEI